MKSNYAYIIAGLPALVLDFDNTATSTESAFDFKHWCDCLGETCSEEDLKLIRLVRIGLESPKLNHLFYLRTAKSKNGFIRNYFSFDMELRNILTAYTAREFKLPAENLLVGDNPVTDLLLHSSSEDFDLKNESSISSEVHKIMQSQYPLEREEKIDQLRWTQVNELISRHYLDIDVILAFVVKGFIVSRWSRMDRRTGAALFKQLVTDIRGNNKQ